MAWKSIVTELLWFLRGDTNIKYLVENGCHIWDGDAYKRYHTTINSDDYIENWVEPGKEREEARKNKGSNGYTKEEFINEIKTDDEFAKTWGELGPIYGKQWRSWKFTDKFTNGEQIAYVNGKIDQIANLINDLKTNPDSRRLMVNAWNVGELDQMVLPPCHFSFQCYSHEEEGKRYLSLAWNQRSVDVGLGLPFNIASYGLLLEIIAQEVGMIPYELIGNLGDCHIYNNHIDSLKEQINREPFSLPKLNINTDFWQTESGECGVGPLKTNLNGFEISDFTLENYQSHPIIKLPLSN
jgi:thymidylate synthase